MTSEEKQESREAQELPSNLSELMVSNLARIIPHAKFLCDELNKIAGYAITERLRREALEDRIDELECYAGTLKLRLQKGDKA